MLFDADDIAFTGSELQIGVVRGSVAKGEWGVSFVRKNVDDESEVRRQVGVECAGCGTILTMRSTKLTGVEIHRFAPFATIKDRVQIGVNLGGGVGKLDGEVRELTIAAGGTNEQAVEAAKLFAPAGVQFKIVPLFKLELAVAGILGPDLKVRASGGLNLPGYSVFNLSVSYFFGAR